MFKRFPQPNGQVKSSLSTGMRIDVLKSNRCARLARRWLVAEGLLRNFLDHDWLPRGREWNDFAAVQKGSSNYRVRFTWEEKRASFHANGYKLLFPLLLLSSFFYKTKWNREQKWQKNSRLSYSTQWLKHQRANIHTKATEQIFLVVRCLYLEPSEMIFCFITEKL